MLIDVRHIVVPSVFTDDRAEVLCCVQVLELKDRFHNLPVWPWVIRAPFGLTGSLGPLAWQFVLLPAIFGKGL